MSVFVEDDLDFTEEGSLITCDLRFVLGVFLFQWFSLQACSFPMMIEFSSEGARALAISDRFPSSRRLQTTFHILDKTTYNLEKYNLQFGQIHVTILDKSNS